MIVIDDKIISDDVVKEQFLCNLSACKGVCCIEGDSGAPLTEEEMGILEAIYDTVEPYLTPEGKEVIAQQGLYVPQEDQKGFETPLVDGKACAYLNYDELGIAKCGIEQAYEDGKIDFQKPVSCHLYPIRIKEYDGFSAVNYDVWDICQAACAHGKKHQLPLYKFVKVALIRKYGEEFYDQLEAAVEYQEQQNNKS